MSVGVPITADAVLLNRHTHKELVDVAALLNQGRSRHATALRDTLTEPQRTSEQWPGSGENAPTAGVSPLEPPLISDRFTAKVKLPLILVVFWVLAQRVRASSA
ncbi:hypothetical protein ACQEUU_03040 [Nonomuraea sp. CA-218870]|uniref:hypothetical protein n=1 Tax=Nonomuraea sp. CA-218870 TaxID=3239998 RepID=UPI003D947238